jgi:hypothetical protein
VEGKPVAMKKLTLLLLLMVAPGLGAIGVALLPQAAGAGLPRDRFDTPTVYDSNSEHQNNALDAKFPGNEKRLLLDGPNHELGVERLKLIFLLMMSLNQYRIPGH